MATPLHRSDGRRTSRGVGSYDHGRVEQITIDFQPPKPRGAWWWRLLRDHPLLCFAILMLMTVVFLIISIVHESGMDRVLLGGTKWRW